MTIENILSLSLNQTIIYLKNGKRRYGLLIDAPGKQEYYEFISNDNMQLHQKNESSLLIEKLDLSSIEAIDNNLK